MEKQYWLNKWTANDIRFHQENFHPALEKHIRPRLSQTSEHVFIPLSGKSRDILWFLKNGCNVIACELSEKACDDFFAENQIPFTKKSANAFICYQAEKLQIWCGDLFLLPAHYLAKVTLWYDRAAIVALPEPMRTQYVNYFKRVTEGAEQKRPQTFLISFEYANSVAQGPPFSISEKEIRDYFSPDYTVELLERYREENISANPKYQGVPVFEVVYRITHIAQ